MRKEWEKLFIAIGKFLPSCLTIWVLVPLVQGSYYKKTFTFLYSCLWLKALPLAKRFFFSRVFGLFFMLGFTLVYFSKGFYRDPKCLGLATSRKRLFE